MLVHTLWSRTCVISLSNLSVVHCPLSDIVGLLSLDHLSEYCVAVSRQTSIYFIIGPKYEIWWQ